MQIIFFLLIFSFISGQVLSVELSNGIRISALDVSLILFLFGFFLQSKFRVEAVKRFIHIFIKYFGLFVLVCLVSLISQITRLRMGQIGISGLYLLRFGVYAGLLPVFALDKRLNKLGRLGLWWAGLGIAVLGLSQYFLYPDLRNLYYLGWDPHAYRVFGTFLDPNFTGIILVLEFFLTWYLWLGKNLSKMIFVLGLVISFMTLLLTYSRGSYLAFIAGVLVLVFWLNISLIRKIGLVSLGGVVFCALLWFLPRPGGEGVNLLRTLSVFSRIENSQEAWNIFLSSPAIGIGFNALRYWRDQTNLTPGTQSLSHSGAGFHNSWLFVLATTGIMGFFAYIWIWAKVLGMGKIKFISQIWDKSGKQLLFVSAVAVFTHSLFDNSLFYPYVMTWMWILAGSTVKVDK